MAYLENYANQLSQMPQRGDFAPSTGRKILSSLMAGGSQPGAGQRGMAFAEAPYNKALQDWQLQSRGARNLADLGLESEGIGARQASSAASLGLGRERLDEQKRQFNVGQQYKEGRDVVGDEQWGRQFGLSSELGRGGLAIRGAGLQLDQRRFALDSELKQLEEARNQGMFPNELAYMQARTRLMQEKFELDKEKFQYGQEQDLQDQQDPMSFGEGKTGLGIGASYWDRLGDMDPQPNTLWPGTWFSGSMSPEDKQSRMNDWMLQQSPEFQGRFGEMLRNLNMMPPAPQE